MLLHHVNSIREDIPIPNTTPAPLTHTIPPSLTIENQLAADEQRPPLPAQQKAKIQQYQAEKTPGATASSPVTPSHLELAKQVLTDDDLHERVKKILEPMHNNLKDTIQMDHENKLAKEVRQVYCQLLKIRRNQAVIFAQTSGLLAAAALGLQRCDRIEGKGQSLLLQKCKEVRVDVKTEETEYGFQPKLSLLEKNFRIGLE